jgi:hypothetical protein
MTIKGRGAQPRGQQVRVKITSETIARVRRISHASGVPYLHLYSVSMALGLRLLELALVKIKPGDAAVGMETALAIRDEVGKHVEELKPTTKKV